MIEQFKFGRPEGMEQVWECAKMVKNRVETTNAAHTASQPLVFHTS